MIIRARERRWQLRALLFLLSFSLVFATEVHRDGVCAMRGQVILLFLVGIDCPQCGTLDVFGKQLPCPDNGLAEEVKMYQHGLIP